MISKSTVLSFLAGAGLVALACYYRSRKSQKAKPKNSQPTPDYTTPEYVSLKTQQLSRVIKYFGQANFTRLQNSFVIIFGVGGVGSHVANMLARSGIKRIRIVDFDRVSLSSLNRHSFAVRGDVGSSKVQCIRKYVREILPHVEIQGVEQYVTVGNAGELVGVGADYVVDCIDNMDAKVELIRICRERNIKLISSGGAGMKCDPTKLQIRDISDCKYDHLILRLKRQLHKQNIRSGVKVVYSYQPAEKQLLPLNEEQEKQPDSFKVFDNYRIRIVPVLGTMPAILGMAIASYVLCDLAGEPYKPFQTDYVKANAIAKVYNELINDERRRGGDIKNMDVDIQQVAILAKQVFKWKSLLSDKKESGLKLSRWDAKKPATIDNLVLLSKDQYEQHFKYGTISEAPYDESIRNKFQQRSEYAKKLYQQGFIMFI